MAGFTDFEHFDVAGDLDFASWDSYPLGFLASFPLFSEAHRKHFLRSGDPDYVALHHDLYRACGQGRWWVMEQQPGPVNWAPYNPAPLPGMARFWALEAFAHCAEAVSCFRWRQAPFGQEQYHSGLNLPTGEPDIACAEIAQMKEELPLLDGEAPRRGDVALVFDYESVWGLTSSRNPVSLHTLRRFSGFTAPFISWDWTLTLYLREETSGLSADPGSPASDCAP